MSPLKNGHRVGFDLDDRTYRLFKKKLIDDGLEITECMRRLVEEYLRKKSF